MDTLLSILFSACYFMLFYSILQKVIIKARTFAWFIDNNFLMDNYGMVYIVKSPIAINTRTLNVAQ
jgi:hypothetical protein